MWRTMRKDGLEISGYSLIEILFVLMIISILISAGPIKKKGNSALRQCKYIKTLIDLEHAKAVKLSQSRRVKFYTTSISFLSQDELGGTNYELPADVKIIESKYTRDRSGDQTLNTISKEGVASPGHTILRDSSQNECLIFQGLRGNRRVVSR